MPRKPAPPFTPRTLWFFDINNRHYVDGQSGPVWRKHWRPLTVVAETRLSWVLDLPIWFSGRTVDRVAKELVPSRMFAWTESYIDELAWVESNRYPILRLIEAEKTPAFWRRLAAMVNYEPNP